MRMIGWEREREGERKKEKKERTTVTQCLEYVIWLLIFS